MEYLRYLSKAIFDESHKCTLAALVCGGEDGKGIYLCSCGIRHETARAIK